MHFADCASELASIYEKIEDRTYSVNDAISLYQQCLARYGWQPSQLLDGLICHGIRTDHLPVGGFRGRRLSKYPQAPGLNNAAQSKAPETILQIRQKKPVFERVDAADIERSYTPTYARCPHLKTAAIEKVATRLIACRRDGCLGVEETEFEMSRMIGLKPANVGIEAVVGLSSDVPAQVVALRLLNLRRASSSLHSDGDTIEITEAGIFDHSRPELGAHHSKSEGSGLKSVISPTEKADRLDDKRYYFPQGDDITTLRGRKRAKSFPPGSRAPAVFKTVPLSPDKRTSEKLSPRNKDSKRIRLLSSPVEFPPRATSWTGLARSRSPSKRGRKSSSDNAEPLYRIDTILPYELAPRRDSAVHFTDLISRHSFYQGGGASSGNSSTTTQLNKLFDRYRGKLCRYNLESVQC